MAFVRLLKDLMRDKEFGQRVVPIIPDEARTFGMDSFFPTIKIYNPHGQKYTSVDAELMLAYKEAKDGQILHLGINEAGSMAAFTAAGTSYATHGEPMVPIYVFYSMFGFQRTADSIWAAADQMARGFLIGATAGRTTLTGEGLQHADGHSPLLAATNPAVVAYDPAFAFEIGHIMEDGLRRMYGDDPENVIYYLTVYNEPMSQPAEPENVDLEGILRGHVPASPPASPRACRDDAPRVQLLASGVGVPWALEAQELLRNDWGVVADVWSVTSWSELRRDGMACDEQRVPPPRGRGPHALRHPAAAGRPRSRSSRCPTTCARCRTRSSSGCRATSPRSAPTGSGSPTPARRRGGSSTSTARRSPCGRCSCSSSVARSTAAWPARRPTRYRLLDVTAGTSGNAGGDS